MTNKIVQNEIIVNEKLKEEWGGVSNYQSKETA